ncbi:MAG: PIN domain-containing protein [Candidatus Omnitrophica bacterium]|nr:PIN domain-containing protein [Candidatus Omnitrophota bacterium]MCA9424714.1 PIN domain-containing protein [Candidatus Omnitrophota bacterium]MCA9429243.1 PIN domain-containing protein [Candidatus Omnitrophota bacterium]MCA9435271.1 PIN domain-containing protein [Candidatus Omnitrophota bacterium]MCA9443479.1 PIN domain-containing protein [Candidatus Omnitrophota bacterium]
MAALVDTNVLVYLFDHRYPKKQKIAEQLLRKGIEEDNVRVPHQALVEFVAATTKKSLSDGPLLEDSEARQEAEEFLHQFTILYPNENVFRLALRGMAAYQLSWFDAHMWAYAEHFGLSEILSEDFQDGRLYGSVQIRNPFD